MSRAVRVLLLWPGADAATAGNFGLPQLVLLATYAQHQTTARVDIRDLELELALGQRSLPQLLAGPEGRGYDIVALSVYSSFDHLKCTLIAELARELWPQAVIVAGGYHPSARPLDYVFDGSAFDVCVVGEGERPLVRIIESVAGGAPLRQIVLGPDPIANLDDLPPSDWSLLSRYREIAPKRASQAQVYLSRGCPFDCAFCMERAKREVSWRPLSTERAVAEIEGLHRFLDLRGWTLYFGDALFGMRKSWRREFLEQLIRANIPVEKYWLLIRVDLIEDEDLRLFAAANCGLGFGLESGDPGQLAIIRKSGRLDSYLDRMIEIAEGARTHQVPWGANVICGHPGETPESMRRSAAYLSKLFLRPGGTTGFLSVDPFRIYPGSPIDAEREVWEQRHGTRFWRPQWWHDGDPEFLSEWVDPSAELDWLERERLQHELLEPLLAQIEENFVYRGQAREYFLRAIREQVTFNHASTRLHYIGRYLAWQGYLGRRGKSEDERRGHATLRELCRSERQRRLPAIAKLAGLPIDHPILFAIEDTPRELFVPFDEVAESVRDVAVALDDSGLATVSAMHAYACAHTLLELEPGERVADLGAGTGYGSALLTRALGPTGSVVAVEIDPALVERGRELGQHLGLSSVEWIVADACEPASWGIALDQINKVVVGFFVEQLPQAWLDAFAPGTVIVVSLRETSDEVRLTRVIVGPQPTLERFDAVNYVPRRSSVDVTAAADVTDDCDCDEVVRLPVIG